MNTSANCKPTFESASSVRVAIQVEHRPVHRTTPSSQPTGAAGDSRASKATVPTFQSGRFSGSGARWGAGTAPARAQAAPGQAPPGTQLPQPPREPRAPRCPPRQRREARAAQVAPPLPSCRPRPARGMEGPRPGGRRGEETAKRSQAAAAAAGVTNSDLCRGHAHKTKHHRPPRAAR